MRGIDLSKYTILVVDDDEINRTVIRHMLKGVSNSVAMAENGSVAMKYLNDHINQEIILLLDINMPVMDGYEVIRRIRDNKNAYSKVRTIVLSANDQSLFVASGLENEVCAYLQKPIDKEVLIHKMAIATVSNN
ncbi:MAG: response regulator [Sediminibacterium sp.]|nr:response regulator [Sediminibacterium sp.]